MSSSHTVDIIHYVCVLNQDMCKTRTTAVWAAMSMVGKADSIGKGRDEAR